jgi:hypothetical protein
VHSESSFAVVVLREQFGNPGKGTSAVGNRYPITSDGQQSKGTQ